MWLMGSKELYLKNVGACMMCLLIMCCMQGCGGYTLAGKWEYSEIQRIKSPDAELEVVLVQGDAGATTSTITYLYLARSGAKLREDQRDRSIFAGDHLEDFAVEWVSRRELRIQYKAARISHFQNFWYGEAADNRRAIVEIKLFPIIPDAGLSVRDRME
jgi:hypothetical protein